MRDVLKLLVSELKSYKKTIVFCTLLAGLAAGFDTLAPIAMGRAFDLAGKQAQLFLYGGAILAWALIRAAADYVRSYIAYRGESIGQEVAEKYQSRTLTQFLDKPLSFHYGKRGPEMMDKVMEMRNWFDSFMEAVVFDLWPAIIATVAIIGYIATIEWRIALALGVSIVVFAAYTYVATPQALAAQKARQEARRKVSTAAWDALRNALVVKSTTNEAYVGSVIDAYAREAVDTIEVEHASQRRLRDVQNAISAFGAFAAVGIGVIDFRNGMFTFGRLTSIMAYSFSIFGYVRYCQWQARTYLKLTEAYGAVKGLSDEPPEDFVSGESVEIHGNVEFRNIRFRYREDKAALEDVSFGVKAGERVAIVGESGEGKTTMVDLLGRYYVPQSGAIFIDGRDAREINLRSLRSQMAYVPQDLTLFHESIGFNIRYGRPDASNDDVHESAHLAHLDAFIDGLPEKYDTVVGERGMKLSGGERQRIALARAFLRDPRILVLDEPTAHLDSKTEEFVRQSLETLMAGRTTFVIAHRLRTVMDADRILVLKDGHIVESGRHEELLKKPGGAYAALLKAQGGLISTDEPHLGQEALSA